MPQFTHDTDEMPNPGDIARAVAISGGMANRLAQIDGHFGRLSIVNPGPPHDEPLAANIRSIQASAAHIVAVANEWLNRQPGAPGNLPP